jgi:hypothetical protein
MTICVCTGQYAIVTKTADWTNKEGLAIFGDLMCQVGSPTEAVLLLLRCTEDQVCAVMPEERQRTLVKQHFDMLMEQIPEAVREAKLRYKPVGFARLQPDWRDNWESLPLKEYWDDPDLVVNMCVLRSESSLCRHVAFLSYVYYDKSTLKIFFWNFALAAQFL